jgi:hypothetical protein
MSRLFGIAFALLVLAFPPAVLAQPPSEVTAEMYGGHMVVSWVLPPLGGSFTVVVAKSPLTDSSGGLSIISSTGYQSFNGAQSKVTSWTSEALDPGTYWVQVSGFDAGCGLTTCPLERSQIVQVSAKQTISLRIKPGAQSCGELSVLEVDVHPESFADYTGVFRVAIRSKTVRRSKSYRAKDGILPTEPDWTNISAGAYTITASYSGDSSRTSATATKLIKVKKCG